MLTAEQTFVLNNKKTILEFIQSNEPLLPILYSHQQETVDRAPKKRLLAYDTGTGKTITSISLVNKHLAKRVLVICPKTNVEQWGIELMKYITKGSFCTVMSKEEFKKQVKTLDKYDAVIIDEGHYFAGINSALSKALYWYLNKKYLIDIVYICTATPYCSTPFNIYTIAKHLGSEGPEWNYMNFKQKFFYYIPMGRRSVPVLRKGMEEEIAKLVKMIGDTVDMKDVVDVPKQTEIITSIVLTDEQIKAIKDIFDPVFIVRWTKQHQIENGFLYDSITIEEDDFSELKKNIITYENNKLSEIIRLATIYEKFIVVARYKEQIRVYEKELKALGYNILVLDGETKERQSIIETANKMDKIIFLIQASVSAGYELPTFRTMVFASLSFSYVDYKQILGRNLRINHLQENTYIHLVSEGVDRDVFNCIQNKKDFTLAIYNNK